MSKEEYDTCRPPGAGARVVAVCDQPAGKQTRPPYTVTFRSFTPQPNGLEFKPGQDYYFISALPGHLNEPARRMSPCRELNMKVIFKVCCKQSSAGAAAAQPMPPSLAPPPALAATALGTPTRQRASGPTKRPGVQAAASTITLRPSVKPAPGLVEATLTPVAGSPQPITVLPIEVLATSADSQQPADQPGSMQADSDRNDIVVSRPLEPPPQVVHRPPPASSLVPFNPRVEPDKLKDNMSRWTPTPLPPRWTAASSWPASAPNQHRAHQPGQPSHPHPQQRHHQHHQQQADSWPAPPMPQPPALIMPGAFDDQQRQPNSQQQHPQQPQHRGSPSRIGLYPWASLSEYPTCLV